MTGCKNIVIIGGGPAGLALATALLQNKENQIIVVEKTGYTRQAVGEHLQAEALTLFDRLKVPVDILLRNSTRCHCITGNWGGRDFLSSSIYNGYGDDFIVHRPEFEKEWCEYLQKNGVVFYIGFSPEVKENNSVILGGKTKLKYDHLIDCSGRMSRFHDSSRLIFDKMIGATFFHDQHSEAKASIIIESSESGWWYHCQSKYRSVTTYFTDHDLYAKDMAVTRYELAKTQIISKLKIALCEKPIVKQCYTSVLTAIPDKIFQVGDAFFSLDPLSSQGIYKAMKQAIKVADLLDSGFSSAAVSGFYESLSREFSEMLKTREFYYKQAHQYHQTDFFKRRVLLGEVESN